MSALHRRGFLALFAGAAVAPLLPAGPKLAAAEITTHEVKFAAAGAFTRYSGYDVLSITPADVLHAAEYDWRAAVTAPR